MGIFAPSKSCLLRPSLRPKVLYTERVEYTKDARKNKTKKCGCFERCLSRRESAQHGTRLMRVGHGASYNTFRQFLISGKFVCPDFELL